MHERKRPSEATPFLDSGKKQRTTAFFSPTKLPSNSFKEPVRLKVSIADSCAPVGRAAVDKSEQGSSGSVGSERSATPPVANEEEEELRLKVGSTMFGTALVSTLPKEICVQVWCCAR